MEETVIPIPWCFKTSECTQEQWDIIYPYRDLTLGGRISDRAILNYSDDYIGIDYPNNSHTGNLIGKLYTPSELVRLIQSKDKTELEVGKWYKFAGNGIKGQIGKCIRSTYNMIVFEPWLNEGTSYVNSGAFYKKDVTNLIELTDLSVIQQYLPDGHVDKVMKPIRRGAIHTYLVALIDRCIGVSNFNKGDIGFIHSLDEVTIIKDGREFCCTVINQEEAGAVKWFATLPEAEEFAKTLKEPVKSAIIGTKATKGVLLPKSERYTTTMFYFNQLREPERSQAIVNYDEDYCSQIVGELYTALNCGFSWTSSPEEDHYWQDLSDRIEDGSYFKEKELLVFGKYKVGDIVVSLGLKEMFKISDKSKEDLLVMDQGTYTDSSLIRPATPEEVEAYNQGIRNITDIKPKDYKEAVNCTTQEEWDFVLSKFNPKNLNNTGWHEYKEDTCLNVLDLPNPINEGRYCDKSYYTNKKYNILTFKQWCDKYNNSYLEEPWVAKVGDWVFRHSKDYNDTHHYYGKIFQVTAVHISNQVKDGDNVTHKMKSLRKATQEEINSVSKSTITTSHEWTANNWYVKVNSQEEGNEVIEAAAKMYGYAALIDSYTHISGSWEYITLRNPNPAYCIQSMEYISDKKERPISDFIGTVTLTNYSISTVDSNVQYHSTLKPLDLVKAFSGVLSEEDLISMKNPYGKNPLTPSESYLPNLISKSKSNLLDTNINTIKSISINLQQKPKTIKL